MRILTTDVFCSAFLMANGARLVDLLVDRTGSRQAGTFVLEGDEKLLEHQEVYSRGEAVASVKAIRDAVTFLRGRLATTLERAAGQRRRTA